MTTEKRTRRKYTEDFKRDAVALVIEQGYKITEAARSLGIGGDLIRRWKQEFEAEASSDQPGTDEHE
ncbi:MAG: transposase, partial [Gammaproteobacteria bacterium]|nr:transposase [Gammaproteobacteria bacterium]